MRTFIFSRRFLIPLFMVWVLHFIYVEWELWRAYKVDFTRKGLPFWLKAEWLFLLSSSGFLLLSFLISFLLALVFFSHFQMKKRSLTSYNFFSRKNLLAVGFISLVSFFYTSFLEPKSNYKSMIILAEIVYSKPGSDFGSLDNESLKRSPAKKSARDMSLTELFHAKDSLKAVALAPKDPFLLGLRNENRERSRIKFLIVKKISLPFGFIIFYFLGVFLGTSFYKIHVVVPLLIGYLILFPSWYYLQIIFERLYKEELVGSFLGANGGTLIFAFIVCSWFLILRKYGLLKKRPEETELLVSTEEKS